MRKHTSGSASLRDPMQWDRNARFAEDFSAPRLDALDRNDHPGAFEPGDTDPFTQMDALRAGIRGSEHRLEMIRDISLRLQQNGSKRL